MKILNLYVNNLNPKIKICPNLYISDENLTWKEGKRSLYVAHEIVMMQPLVDKDNTYFKFLSANSWIKEFIPNFEINEVSINNSNFKETTFLDLFERFLMLLQKFLMKIRFGFEILEKDMIHFIKVDHSESVLENYEKIKS